MSENSWILEKLGEVEKDEFLVFKDRIYSYSDLISNINTWRSKLKRLGVAEGECVALIGDYSPNIIFLFLALVLNKNIIVPIGRESQDKLDEMLSVAKVNKCFQFDTEDNWEFTIAAEISDSPLLDVLRRERESGIIIFTSGTSGKSKAAVLNTSKLIEKYQISKRKPFRTLIFLKLDHIGGINTLFSIMFNGGTIITSEGRTPQAVCEVIQNQRVELLPTTPTFLNMLLMARSYESYDISSLKIITYGTEPMPQSTLNSVNRLFPLVTLKQTYGLTELGIFSTKSKDNHSNWLKVGGKGIETKIVDNTLWIKASSAMLGYLNAPSPFDENGWYNTGDEVEVDGEYIRILGRKSEIINVGGEKVYPAEVESVLLEIPNIKDVLVTGKRSPITGQIVTAAVVLEQPEEIKDLKKRIIEYCKIRLLPYKIPTIITISDKELVSERFKKMRCI
ncbi:MAG: long-chain fatty acid--CoA ligase [Clostridia bacterium]|nr:long-chain fatty acid--CoA ligase [Clostridia bacterium]